jgi:short subunit dehydrogenase-like uncharacterized protein
MSGTWMICGANGYTGRLAARQAKEHFSARSWPYAIANASGCPILPLSLDQVGPR